MLVFGPHRVAGRELSEFFSVFYLRAKELSHVGAELSLRSLFETVHRMGNLALAIVFESRQFWRLQNAFENSVFETSEVASTKTL